MSSPYYSIEAYTLAEQVLGKARGLGLSLGTAESLTGGLIAAALTAVPGSSDTFKGGVVSYAYEVKERVLDVPHDILYTKGAVEEEVALQMARGAQQVLDCDITVSVTGIAGPGGEEPGKPVGTVWMGLCVNGQASAQLLSFQGSRDSVRNQTVVAALQAIFDALD